MAKNLFITTAETKSGKSVISLGVMEILRAVVPKVAFFRPIIQDIYKNGDIDPDINLITTYHHIDIPYENTYAYSFNQAKELINAGKNEELIEGIMTKYKNLEENFDFVLIEGTDFAGISTAFEFNINAEIANNLGAPVLVVSSGRGKSISESISSLNLALESYENQGCQILGSIVTRVPKNGLDELKKEMEERLGQFKMLKYAIPENEVLGRLSLYEIEKALDAEVIYGQDQLQQGTYNLLVAAMQLRNFLQFVTDGCLVITPGDRADIILASVLSSNSLNFPRIRGLVLTGGLVPEDSVKSLISTMVSNFPILSVKYDTMTTISMINSIDTKVSPDDNIRISTALGIFEAHVNTQELTDEIIETRSKITTPKMFEYDLIQKAKSDKQHIVLPEGTEPRILQAAEMLIRREVVDITLLGNEKEVQSQITLLGLKLEGVNIIDPETSPKLEEYAQTYFEARKHKGIQMENAIDALKDPSYYGTMMVFKGDADGMVSGSVNTTQHTIRPSFEFVKTQEGYNIVSSIFFMCLEDRALVYGDCAVNPNPNAEELAEIAVVSAETACMFGIEPRVAMLSYSTGASGKGEDVEKVREATRIAKERAPKLKIEGPLQYDAAVDPGVAKTKMPDSEVAGQATVFIFPDLNTGNNTYKAVQRSANAVAIGPVLQGLRKPVNDLSRGCTVPDIINTVAITAIQAQGLNMRCDV